jgi:hypothetical protein
MVDGPTRHLRKWEDRGWVGVPDRELWKALVYELRRRSAQVDFKWIKNRKADGQIGKARRIAEKGVEDPSNERVSTSVPAKWLVRGAKLSGLKQRTAYMHLVEGRMKEPTRTRVRNVSLALAALSKTDKLTSRSETDIWKDMWGKEVRKPVAQFFYALVNGAHRVGRFWLHVEGKEEYARCQLCDAEVESMEHILLQCKANHRKLVWDTCRKAWPEEGSAWPDITIGTIMGCNSIVMKAKSEGPREPRSGGKEKTGGRSRLMSEFIREATHMIWAMRCERAVGKRTAEHTASEVVRRWHDKIVDRFKADRALILRAGKPPSKVRSLCAKWDNIVDVDKALDLVQEPVRLKGFLVGTERPP